MEALKTRAEFKELVAFMLSLGHARAATPLSATVVRRRNRRLLHRSRRQWAGGRYVYFEDEAGRRTTAKFSTRDEAQRIAANIAKLPDLLKRPTGATNAAVLAICERVAEVQAMLHDYFEADKPTTAADVIAKAQAVQSESNCCGRCSMSATSRRTRRRINDGRYAPKSGHPLHRNTCPLWANSDISHRRKAVFRGSSGCGTRSVYSVLAKVMITRQAASCFWTIGRFVQTGENERAVPLVEQTRCCAMQ